MSQLFCSGSVCLPRYKFFPNLILKVYDGEDFQENDSACIIVNFRYLQSSKCPTNSDEKEQFNHTTSKICL